MLPLLATKRSRKMPRILSFCLAVATTMDLVSSSPLRTDGSRPLALADPFDRTFGLLFDAGSTGTRLSVYSWPTRLFDILPPNLTAPLELVYFSNRSAPGIDVPAGRQYLTTLVAQAQTYLANSAARWGSFPIYLTATAGMRILPSSEQALAMTEVRAILSASPFMFQPNWARIIAGEEEGVYGWVAANYLLGRLITPGGALGTNLIGALDMGGASAQVTFTPPTGAELIAGAFDVSVTQSIRQLVYTHSYLYYGQNEGMNRIAELVVLSAYQNGVNMSAGSIVPNPCFFTSSPLYDTDFLSATLGGQQIFFNGTGNFSDCLRYAQGIMLKAAPCMTDYSPTYNSTTAIPGGNVRMNNPFPAVASDPAVNPSLQGGQPGSTCAIAGTYQAALQPPPGMAGANVSLLAFSSYSYLWEFLDLPLTVPLSVLRDTLVDICATDFSVINATKGTPGNQAYLATYCLVGTFQYAFLAHGLGVPIDTTFITVASASGVPVTYAAGAMMYFVNSLAWQAVNGTAVVEGSSQWENLRWALGIPLGVTILVAGGLGCALIGARKRAKRATLAAPASTSREEYSPPPPPLPASGVVVGTGEAPAGVRIGRSSGGSLNPLNVAAHRATNWE